MTDEKDTASSLEQKVTSLGTLANVCVTWWVSSVVFCGSILAAVWINRGELVESNVIGWLGFFLFMFFLSIIGFGILVIVYLCRLHRELKRNHKGYFSREIKFFIWAMSVGTSSFILILVGWLCLWIGLSSGSWKVKPPEAQPNNSFNRTRNSAALGFHVDCSPVNSGVMSLRIQRESS